MNDPRIMLFRIKVVFDVICFLLALSMAIDLIGRYNEDENATSTAYKKYGKTLDDKYPSFSVCLEGDGLYRFNDTSIFWAYGVHRTDYEMMLNGKNAYQYDYDPSNRGYIKSLVPSKFQPESSFEMLNSFEIPGIIKNSIFLSENPKQNIIFGYEEGILNGKVVNTPPFYINYRSSKFYCLSRDSITNSDLMRLNDSMTLNTSLLDSNLNLKIFIHYPGQLLRVLDNPSFISGLSNSLNKAIRLKISQTTVLRQRSNQNERCNYNILDYDLFLQESVANETDCIPPYWKNGVGKASILPECRSPEQFKKVHDLIEDYKKILSNRDVPCLNMFTSVVWNWIENLKTCEKCTYFEVLYSDKHYEEIAQRKEFGVHDFISSLGGFIGIFLGYSMMQIPQLLGMLEACKIAFY